MPMSAGAAPEVSQKRPSDFRCPQSAGATPIRRSRDRNTCCWHRVGRESSGDNNAFSPKASNPDRHSTARGGDRLIRLCPGWGRRWWEWRRRRIGCWRGGWRSGEPEWIKGRRRRRRRRPRKAQHDEPEQSQQGHRQSVEGQSAPECQHLASSTTRWSAMGRARRPAAGVNAREQANDIRLVQIVRVLAETTTRASIPASGREEPKPAAEAFLSGAEQMTEYWVFQDKPFKRACIHRSNCSIREAARNSGFSEGTWHGAFVTYEEARRTAVVMSPQKGAQRNCRLCQPQNF